MSRIKVECMMIKSLPVKQRLSELSASLFCTVLCGSQSAHGVSQEDLSPTGAMRRVAIYFRRNTIRPRSLICTLLNLCTELADTWIWKSRTLSWKRHEAQEKPYENHWHHVGKAQHICDYWILICPLSRATLCLMDETLIGFKQINRILQSKLESCYAFWCLHIPILQRQKWNETHKNASFCIYALLLIGTHDRCFLLQLYVYWERGRALNLRYFIFLIPAFLDKIGGQAERKTCNWEKNNLFCQNL